VEAYARAQGLWHDESSRPPSYSEVLELDLSSVVPSIAGPKRPQDLVALSEAKNEFRAALPHYLPDPEDGHAGGGGSAAQETGSWMSFPASDPPSSADPGAHAMLLAAAAAAAEAQGPEGFVMVAPPASTRVDVTLADGTRTQLNHGHVVIAAITSCTNTSNPSVMLAAGILARNAVARGLRSKPWVKTSLAPGSKVVTEYLARAGLTGSLETLGFHLVGYGCTTCIGNSGPLAEEISRTINDHDLAVVSVLSGNRNFEGRINADVKLNYLASPPLCVAYALAGTMDCDIAGEPLGEDEAGRPVYLRDIWPTEQEVAETVERAVHSDMFRRSYGEVFDGDERWRGLVVPTGDRFAWDDASTYVRQPSFFESLSPELVPVAEIAGARALAVLGDSVTTDHISPAGSIKRDGPAGRYLQEHGVVPGEFNSYGSRRGNHEVMVRGTFANIRLRNQLAPGTEGGVTRHLPDGEAMSIYDAAMRYQADGVPLVVLGGKEYGSGSSRDWAAKGTMLLGVRAVIAESFERIHRSNLVGMGVLALQFADGDTVASLGLSGEESFTVSGFADELNAGGLPVHATVRADGREFRVRVRIDTPKEADYFRHGGILRYVLRQLMASG
ncbi:MAG: aconitate hydratase, partial [Solirubrobacteraceae bacterium]|nr:aconitate hydratase [Solirubrobacteraceae bacterium]